MSFGRLLGEAIVLGRKYPLIYLPVLAVALLVGLLMALFFGGPGALPPGVGTALSESEGVMSNFWGMAVWAIVAGVLVVAGHTLTVIMAGQVLRVGTASLREGVEQARARLVPLLIAAGATALLVGIGFVLFVLPGLAIGFFLLFTFVAVALEGYPALAGMRKSFVVVKNRISDAFVFYLLLIALGVLFALFNQILLFIPIIGGILSLVLSGLYSGYVSTLVVLGYRELNSSGLDLGGSSPQTGEAGSRGDTTGDGEGETGEPGEQ
ncbi:MAG: hypothetical protein ACLFP6_05030 [Spirochaetaceae bacterium]